MLNDNLLPITSIMEPQLEDEVKAMLADVEKRAGFAKVSLSIDPWAVVEDDSSGRLWYSSELYLEGLSPLLLFTKSEMVSLDIQSGPVLYRPGFPPVRTSVRPIGQVIPEDDTLTRAREYTRRIFWGLNSSRMDWDDINFSYLFLPKGNIVTEWDTRRSWLFDVSAANPERHPYKLSARADIFGEEFGYPTDLTLVQRQMGMGRALKFMGWCYDPLPVEEEERLRGRYKWLSEIEIKYPLLVVQAYSPRTNLLIPLAQKNPEVTAISEMSPAVHYLLPRYSGVIMLSPEETEFSFLLPSVLRSLSMTITAYSLRKTLFYSSPLSSLELPLLTVALTAPASGERQNYQRLETLGDTVLKFVTGVQLLAEYPLWHEGYLTRKKDHAVSNARLAKENIAREMYRWIIRGAHCLRVSIKLNELMISYRRTDAWQKMEAKIFHGLRNPYH